MAVVSKQGFTLLELLVTISIIGILLAVGSVSFSTAQKKGRDSRRQADMTAIQKSLEQCYGVDARYPATVTPGSALQCVGLQTVMNLVPNDPKGGTGYAYVYTTDVGATKTIYCLCAHLENLGKGNANTTGANGVCSWDSDGAGNDYFCVSSQQ